MLANNCTLSPTYLPLQVMPWVLADYTSNTLDLSDPAAYRDLSKPIGALNPRRLADFQQRYAELKAMAAATSAAAAGGKLPPGAPPPLDMPPFLYGCHYSSPGYVVFYLMRSDPQLMLRLQVRGMRSPALRWQAAFVVGAGWQAHPAWVDVPYSLHASSACHYCFPAPLHSLQNGRFDAPDRLFWSIADTWKSVLSLPSDVKVSGPAARQETLCNRAASCKVGNALPLVGAVACVCAFSVLRPACRPAHLPRSWCPSSTPTTPPSWWVLG